jgi:hypothetical protein
VVTQQVLASFRLAEERNRVISTFGQHVSPAVVEKLLAQEVELAARSGTCA